MCKILYFEILTQFLIYRAHIGLNYKKRLGIIFMDHWKDNAIILMSKVRKKSVKNRYRKSGSYHPMLQQPRWRTVMKNWNMAEQKMSLVINTRFVSQFLVQRLNLGSLLASSFALFVGFAKIFAKNMCQCPGQSRLGPKQFVIE